MRKKKIFSLLLAGALIGQTFSMGALTASAEENPLVGKEQLSDNNTAAPKKDDVVPNANQYEYQKQELADQTHLMNLNGEKTMEIRLRTRFLSWRKILMQIHLSRQSKRQALKS